MAIRFTLLGDGGSDKVLIRPIQWVLRDEYPTRAFQGEWADLSRLPHPPKKLHERIQSALKLYPCDILFIHRDAENQPFEQRRAEIVAAWDEVATPAQQAKICVVPVRMTEAWFLFDEPALREAAGNPNGREVLELPDIVSVEKIQDPKACLQELLRQASGLHGRRLHKFQTSDCIHRLARKIRDYSSLKRLSAFQDVVAQIRQVMDDGLGTLTQA